MTIGRFLLALLLATISSSLVYFIVTDLPPVLASYAHGDPAIMAGMLSAAIMDLILGLVGVAILGFLVGRLISFLYLRPSQSPRPIVRYILESFVTIFALFAAFQALYLIGASGVDVEGLPLAFAGVLAAAAAWGFVFWTIDLRSSRNAQSAAEHF